MVEAGLRHVLELPTKPGHRFELRKASFAGRGLQKDAQGMSWKQLREMSYGFNRFPSLKTRNPLVR